MNEDVRLKCPHIGFDGCRWCEQGGGGKLYCVYGAFELPEGRSIAIDKLKKCPIMEST